MNKKIYPIVGAGIGILLILIFVGISSDKPMSREFSELDFSYDAVNSDIKNNLVKKGINMSAVLKFSDPKAVESACPLIFLDKTTQKIVEYCTSSDLIDSQGNYLGNIHIVGSPNAPKFIAVLIQVNPFMDELNSVKNVFQSTIKSIVCECWEDFKPSGFETIDDWIDVHREFHLQATRTTSISKVDLSGKHLEIEITTNQEGYLWKLFITNKN